MPETRDGNMSRRRIATMILIRMLDSPGDPESKVYAAVNYTDKLIECLDKARTRRRGADTRSEQTQENLTTARERR